MKNDGTNHTGGPPEGFTARCHASLSPAFPPNVQSWPANVDTRNLLPTLNALDLLEYVEMYWRRTLASLSLAQASEDMSNEKKSLKGDVECCELYWSAALNALAI